MGVAREGAWRGVVGVGRAGGQWEVVWAWGILSWLVGRSGAMSGVWWKDPPGGGA